MVQRKARNGIPQERVRDGGGGGGWGWAWETLSHYGRGGSISKMMLKTEGITTSLLVDGNIKEALDL